MKISGHFLDGQSSKRFGSCLTLNQTDHRVVDFVVFRDAADQLITIGFCDLKIESRLGNIPREISLGEGRLFVTDDNDAVDELLRGQGASNTVSLLHRLESNISLIVFSTLSTLLCVWVSITYGIPVLAEKIAYNMPELVLEELGGGLDLLDGQYFDPSGLAQDRQEEVRALFEPYFISHANLYPKLNFRSGVGPNAFALPNGDIVFTDEFIELAKTDEELLAVLFHELGHLRLEHNF